jgi:hypothetical protein
MRMVLALRDGRLGRESPHKAADVEVEAITRLYQERYRDFSVAHFHDFARQNHGLTRSYSWKNSLLKREGLVEKSNRGGPHRLRGALIVPTRFTFLQGLGCAGLQFFSEGFLRQWHRE